MQLEEYFDFLAPFAFSSTNTSPSSSRRYSFPSFPLTAPLLVQGCFC